MLWPGRTGLTVFFIFTLQISLTWCMSSPTLDFGNIVMNLLENFERCEDWNGNMYLSLLFGQFLVKQATRFYNVSRVDQYLYDLILKRIVSLRSRIDAEAPHLTDKWILQKNVVPVRPERKQKHLTTYLEYNSLVANYSKIMNKGFPSPMVSDFCLQNITRIEDCSELNKDCLSIMRTRNPTYGYFRMHQILLLYLMRHSKCYQFFGSSLTFEILANEFCSQAYREHKAIIAIGSKEFQDLYFEQSAICGLFGYTEFLNMPELKLFIRWEKQNKCRCYNRYFMYDYKQCNCGDHMHSLALIHFINAVTHYLF